MRDVNRILARQSDAAMFVTLFYGILDTRTGEVDYCNAGHHPACLFSPGGGFRFADEGGGVVAGMFEQWEYTGGKVKMEPGECMVLYTDGVSEAFDEQENMFGEERLREVVEASGPLPLEQLVKKILGEVTRFAGSVPQSDDITVFALRYRGTNANP
jgi:sigma-B regulation protein RsbU (phosphoserine phosphatase)